ncbi:TOBE domain-containing protein [Noviherbaspirillum pedocola]|uniref:TOBE domain-containing protein n=1 Tax=Noviherbaspirillum pedocola TaxID=2801341 RepID=A0A934SW82_9BURK|nr:TOBE domain-containing protein [Noviherbaspirillum pedocola]MBK4733952.1 TOBE domain-containing protein [Noviherbaspirillum pedocola]
MKTSARNQLAGIVTVLTPGAVNDEVEIEVGPGVRIVATITRTSTQSLGLAVGKPAFALIKASSVLIATDVGDVKLSSRNQLRGTVSAVRPGAVNAEVDLDIGGGSIAAIVTMESLQALGLAVGTPALALFKASSVIVGTRS